MPEQVPSRPPGPVAQAAPLLAAPLPKRPTVWQKAYRRRPLPPLNVRRVPVRPRVQAWVLSPLRVHARRKPVRAWGWPSEQPSEQPRALPAVQPVLRLPPYGPRRRLQQAARRLRFRQQQVLQRRLLHLPGPAVVPGAVARRCRWRTPSRRRYRTRPASASVSAVRGVLPGRRRLRRPVRPRRRALRPGWRRRARPAAPVRRDGRAGGPARVLPASAVRLGSCVQSRTQLVHRIAQPRFHCFPAYAGDLADLLQAQFLIQPQL